MTPTYPPERLIQTAEDAVAAAVCFLARFRGLGVELGGVQGARERLHVPPCRYCSTPEKELVSAIDLWNHTHDLRAAQIRFDQDAPKVRWARIHEAQRIPWYDELPEGAL